MIQLFRDTKNTKEKKIKRKKKIRERPQISKLIPGPLFRSRNMSAVIYSYLNTIISSF